MEQRITRSASGLLTTLVLIGIWVLTSAASLNAQANGYSLEQVVRLIRAGVARQRIMTLLSAECITFRPNVQTDRVLREAGADDSFLDFLRTVCQGRAATQPPRVDTRTREERRAARYGAGASFTIYGSNMVVPTCCSDMPPLQLSQLVDRSPRRTYVHPGYLREHETQPVYSVGAAIRPRRAGAMVLVEYYLLEDGVAGGASLGWHPFVPLGLSGIRFIPGVAIRTDLVDIPIGQVGRNEADGYYVGPTGEQFNSPAKIRAFGPLLGGEASAGVALNLTARTSLFAEAGWRLMRGIGTWKYRIEQGGLKIDLDPEGIPFKQTDFSVSGSFLRVGLSF